MNRKPVDKSAESLVDIEKIEESEFFPLYFFHYILDAGVYLRLQYEADNFKAGSFQVKLFDLAYESDEAAGLGIGIGWDWKSNNRNGSVFYFRYGGAEAWGKFKSAFAAQFAGDNS